MPKPTPRAVASSVPFDLVLGVGGALLVAGCLAQPGDAAPDVATAAAASAAGAALPGISADDFAAFQASFNAEEDITDGVGPIFNNTACGNCHNLGGAGGAGEQIVRRFGRFDRGLFNSLASEGGSLRQLSTVGAFTGAGGQACVAPLEVEPADATVHDVGRVTTPLFGLGLVDAIPDGFFDALAAAQPPAIRGWVNRVTTILPNPADPGQAVGAVRVGRFGWKAGVPNLAQFAADAYMNEMGITTQHCIGGRSILDFATEAAPNGVPQPVGCDDLAPADPALPVGTDEGVGSCAGGRTELQADVEAFTRFMTFLAPPPADAAANPAVVRQGMAAFGRAGCNGCHVDVAFRTPAAPANGVPGGLAFKPYSDFLLHDMGALGDLIGNDGDTVAQTRRMRTAPLWGLRFRTRLLHDGRATDVPAAILQHDGQAAGSVAAYRALAPADQAALVTAVRAM